MFDPLSITRVVFEEILLMAASIRHDGPATVEEKLAEATKLEPLPTEQAFAQAIEEVFWGSLLTEEGRHCRFRLTYCDQSLNPRSDRSHLLRDPIPLDRHNLKNLAFAHDYKSGGILWREQDGRRSIVGIRSPFRGGEPCGLTIRATAPGVLDVTWGFHRIVLFNRGRVSRISSGRLQTLDVINRLAGPVFGTESPSAFVIRQAIRMIVQQGHGGSIWILGEGASPPPTINVKYHVTGGFGLLAGVESMDERSSWLNCLARLTGVDGAVLVDASLRVLGFGAFIDMTGEHYMRRLLPSGETERVAPSAIGGGRHRAAVTFCAKAAPALAYVVSQDKRLSVAWALSPGEEPFFTEVFPLELADFSFV